MPDDEKPPLRGIRLTDQPMVPTTTSVNLHTKATATADVLVRYRTEVPVLATETLRDVRNRLREAAQTAVAQRMGVHAVSLDIGAIAITDEPQP